MSSQEKFSFGTCSFCGGDLGDEVVMEKNWYGDSMDTYYFCDDICKQAFSEQQSLLKMRGQNMYTPMSQRPNVAYSFVLSADRDSELKTVDEVLDSHEFVTCHNTLYDSILSIDMEDFKVLYDYYMADIEEHRGRDGYIHQVKVVLSFPPEEFEQIIKLLKKYNDD